MIEVIQINLENEMDISLAHQKTLKIADLLKLSMSARTTFATTVSEVTRVVIDYTDSGILSLGFIETDRRFQLVACVTYLNNLYPLNTEKFHYARKLVPILDISQQGNRQLIKFAISLPRSIELSTDKIISIQSEVNSSIFGTAYENIKHKILKLNENVVFTTGELKDSRKVIDLKNEYISMASHELKTPITVLRAYTQIALSDKMKSVAQIQELVKKIDIQCTKLSLLALQLLDTAKIENGELDYDMQETDLHTYLKRIIGDLSYILPHHQLEMDISSSNIEIKIDALRIEQVISNLLGNAAKYSKPGTTVKLYTTLAANQIIISIQDQGIGISAESLPKVFNKFYRDKEVIPSYSGLGMGMFIAAKIVAGHQGNIWVESTLGEGTTFHFSLPLNNF